MAQGGEASGIDGPWNEDLLAMFVTDEHGDVTLSNNAAALTAKLEPTDDGIIAPMEISLS